LFFFEGVRNRELSLKLFQILSWVHFTSFC
jgi:hypothetical protein